MIHQLVYLSSATIDFDDRALLELLEASRRNNARDGLTGLLLFRNGNFIQVLEGAKPSIEALLERLSRDPRHRGIIRLLAHDVPERTFGDWSMGFRNLKDPSLASVPGFSEFMNLPLATLAEAGSVSKVERLLEVFRASHR